MAGLWNAHGENDSAACAHAAQICWDSLRESSEITVFACESPAVYGGPLSASGSKSRLLQLLRWKFAVLMRWMSYAAVSYALSGSLLLLEVSRL